MPYPLRPLGNGTYKLIGDCYIHGIMDGESMKMKNIGQRTFALW